MAEKLVCATQVELDAYVLEQVRELDNVIAISANKSAKIIDRMYYPGGVHGDRPQMLLTVEPIPEQI